MASQDGGGWGKIIGIFFLLLMIGMVADGTCGGSTYRSEPPPEYWGGR